MKILEITVKFAVKTEEEGNRLMLALGIEGNPIKQAIVKKPTEVAAEEPYIPLSERTRMALEALKRCKRVSVLKDSVLEAWASAYPHIDIANEIAKCEAWAESKSVSRTARGWQKALNTWLSKAQDNTRGNTYNSQIPHKVASPIATPIAVEAEVEAWLKAAN